MSSPKNFFDFFNEKADLKNSPNFENGIPSETELRYRSEGPKFIQEVL